MELWGVPHKDIGRCPKGTCALAACVLFDQDLSLNIADQELSRLLLIRINFALQCQEGPLLIVMLQVGGKVLGLGTTEATFELQER